jgi:hypothetical protein
MMKNFFKTLFAAWLTGAVLGGGCMAGAAATGMILPKGKAEARWAQAQVAEMQTTLERIERDLTYDYIAANPRFDEMAGLE